MHRVAIMATGGMDSTVLMYEEVAAGRRPFILSMDYGHIAFEKQLEMLKYHINKLKLDDVEILNMMVHSWQAIGMGLFTPNYQSHEKDPLNGWDQLRYEETFIEGRNMIMIAYALAFCSAHEIDELLVGYLYGEAEWNNRRTYKLMTGDNSPQFVDMMNLLSTVGLSYQTRIRAPFYERRWDKKKVYDVGITLGVDFSKTYSCYFVPACGKCDNCLLRKDIIGE